MGLGPLDLVSPEEAREAARLAKKRLREGLDPIEARAEQKATQKTERALAKAANITFEDCTELYFKHHSAKWKNPKHRAQFLSTLRAYAYPFFGSLPVAAIDKTLVLKALIPIWEKKTETASRVRGRIESVLDFAKVSGYRSGDNPASWDGNLVHALPAPSSIAKVEHHAALPYREVPEFLTALAKREGIAARALEFTILTAVRTGEVIGAKWNEIDFHGTTWTIPAARMKMKKEHRVPLSDRAIAILRALPREADYVFIGARKGEPLSNMAMAELLKRMERTHITVHGFRSTFRDWSAETTAYPNHVVEMALAHVIGDKVEAAYRRGDLFEKRRRLMADWSRYCYSPSVSADTVTPLRGRA
jgi:integrase